MIYESVENKKNEMVCEACYPKAKEFGEIIPGAFLFENEGKYGLMAQPGHRDYEIFYFPDKPTPDPDPECTSEDEAADIWLDKVLEWGDNLKLNIYDGYFIVDGCKEAGCEKSDVLMWLYDRAGKMLL